MSIEILIPCKVADPISAIKAASPKLDDAKEAASANLQVAICKFQMGSLAEASNLVTKALDMFEEANHELGQAVALILKSKCKLDDAKPIIAKECAVAASELFTKLKSKKGEMVAMEAVSRAEIGLGKSQEALKVGRELQGMYTAAKDTNGEIAAIELVSDAFKAMGNKSRAAEVKMEIRAIFTAQKNKAGEADLLASIALDSRTPKEIQLYAGQAATMYQELGDQGSAAQMKKLINDALLKQANRSSPETLAPLKKVLAAGAEGGDVKPLFDVAEALYSVKA